VVYLPTSKGLVYFKKMAPLFTVEPRLIQFISKHISENVPEIIAANNTLSCFLMKDAGRNLREYLKDNYQIDLLCRALDIYTPMQLLSIPHVDALLDNGIQDWRLGRLPSLYLQFMSQEIF
jgi:hypothetical protein